MRALVIVTTLIALGATAGCGGRNGARHEHVAAQKENAAIHATFRLKDWRWAVAMFPSHVGSRRCVIHGPASEIRVAGICATRVRLGGDGSTLVVFVEDWSKNYFGRRRRVLVGNKRCNGLPTRPSPKLRRYAYVFRIRPNGSARLACQYGDIPPYFVD